jgi:hypothetical protein
MTLLVSGQSHEVRRNRCSGSPPEARTIEVTSTVELAARRLITRRMPRFHNIAVPTSANA